MRKFAWDCPKTSSVSIEFLSSAARVTWAKFQQGFGCFGEARPGTRQQTPGIPGPVKIFTSQKKDKYLYNAKYI